MRLKTWTEDALVEPSSEHFGRVQVVLLCAALLSVAEFLVEHFVPHVFPRTFFWIQWVTTIIFTLEYLGRLWVAPVKRAYVVSVLGLLDLLSIVPSYIGMGNFTFLKAVRIIRTFRILRLVGAANNFRYFKKKDKSF